MPRRNARSEKQEQRLCKKLYRQVGCELWDTSQPFRAKITPGLPDLVVFHRGKGVMFYHEVKRNGAQLTAAQEWFKDAAEACGQTVVVGGVDEAIRQLKTIGIVASKES